jgi:hypothetical protein
MTPQNPFGGPDDVGFADAVAEAAAREAESVVADLARVHFRADQVLRVLRALNLPVPTALDALASPPARTGLDAPAPAEPERAPSAPAAPAADQVDDFDPPSSAPSIPSDSLGGDLKSNGASATEPAGVGKSPGKAPAGVAKTTTKGKAKRKPPVFPGIEVVPEHLRAMPAAAKNGPPKSRIAAAEKQFKVYNYVKTQDTVVGNEVAEALQMQNGSQAADYLRQLADAGLIRRTGKNRHEKNYRAGAPGRVSVEYAPLADTSAPAVVDTPTNGDDNDLQVLVNKVRKVLVDFAGTDMTIGEIAELAQVSRIAAVAVMGQLVANGSVRKKRPPGAKEDMFTYTKPNDPGKAAELDRKSRPVESPGARDGNAPVAGTGRGPRAANKEVQAVIDAAVRAGADPRDIHQSGGHWSIKGPKGRVLIPSTPAPGGKSLMTAKSRLRSVAGLEI